MNEEKDSKTSGKGSAKSSPPAPDARAGSGSGGETWSTKIVSGLMSQLGLAHRKAVKNGAETEAVSTRLAHQRTNLAMERSYMAAERTLMGWIRTSLSMISFGFTIGKLGQVLHDVNIKGVMGRVRTVSIENIAYFLVILGTVALLGAAFQYRRRVRELYAMGLDRRLGFTLTIALMLVAMGAFALCGLVLAL